MIIPTSKEALHKAWLYRLLINLIDDAEITQKIYFKGGTCASMLGFLDRFSVDLDFDIKRETDKKLLRRRLHQVFRKISLSMKYENPQALQFVLKYSAPPGQRNTINLDIIDTAIVSSKYKAQYLSEIDRFATCQTIETMFAHKLVATTDRFQKYKTIAGRDIYDIHFFATHGFSYSQEVIEERTKIQAEDYLKELTDFIKKHFTQRIIDQDLNTLLPKEKFDAIRKTLKTEVLMLLSEHI